MSHLVSSISPFHGKENHQLVFLLFPMGTLSSRSFCKSPKRICQVSNHEGRLAKSGICVHMTYPSPSRSTICCPRTPDTPRLGSVAKYWLSKPEGRLQMCFYTYKSSGKQPRQVTCKLRRRKIAKKRLTVHHECQSYAFAVDTSLNTRAEYGASQEQSMHIHTHVYYHLDYTLSIHIRIRF